MKIAEKEMDRIVIMDKDGVVIAYLSDHYIMIDRDYTVGSDNGSFDPKSKSTESKKCELGNDVPCIFCNSGTCHEEDVAKTTKGLKIISDNAKCRKRSKWELYLIYAKREICSTHKHCNEKYNHCELEKCPCGDAEVLSSKKAKRIILDWLKQHKKVAEELNEEVNSIYDD